MFSRRRSARGEPSARESLGLGNMRDGIRMNDVSEQFDSLWAFHFVKGFRCAFHFQALTPHEQTLMAGYEDNDPLVESSESGKKVLHSTPHLSST
mmetsp:Transcript_38623/g.115960  ORF Transcript_38623/g.115960 Transcript_38623/m.115960 type:complete len:95 (-) Transcript_38623:313-597(-)